MHLAALVVALIGCVAIIAIGSRFLLAPRQATLAYGVAADILRALTEIKGVRDITSGAMLLVVWVAAGRTALGWALIAAALTPTANALTCSPTAGSSPSRWASTGSQLDCSSRPASFWHGGDRPPAISESRGDHGAVQRLDARPAMQPSPGW